MKLHEQKTTLSTARCPGREFAAASEDLGITVAAEERRMRLIAMRVEHRETKARLSESEHSTMSLDSCSNHSTSSTGSKRSVRGMLRSSRSSLPSFKKSHRKQQQETPHDDDGKPPLQGVVIGDVPTQETKPSTPERSTSLRVVRDRPGRRNISRSLSHRSVRQERSPSLRGQERLPLRNDDDGKPPLQGVVIVGDDLTQETEPRTPERTTSLRAVRDRPGRRNSLSHRSATRQERKSPSLRTGQERSPLRHSTGGMRPTTRRRERSVPRNVRSTSVDDTTVCASGSAAERQQEERSVARNKSFDIIRPERSVVPPSA